MQGYKDFALSRYSEFSGTWVYIAKTYLLSTTQKLINFPHKPFIAPNYIQYPKNKLSRKYLDSDFRFPNKYTKIR